MCVPGVFARSLRPGLYGLNGLLVNSFYTEIAEGFVGHFIFPPKRRYPIWFKFSTDQKVKVAFLRSVFALLVIAKR